MLRSLWITCVLAVVAPAIAFGQAVPTTADVQKTVASDEGKLAQLNGQFQKLAQKSRDQLATVDALKKEKQSWRRERELRAAMADAADTAKQLEALSQQVAAANQKLGKDRKELVAAIDRELTAGAAGPRAVQLRELRAKLDTSSTAALKKIVLPDAEIDRNADPEDLDQQAQAIIETEKQLANQVAGLDAQASELAHVAEMRKHNERAKDLMLSEDDQPHRNAQHSSNGREADLAGAAPTQGTGGGAGAGGDGGSFSGQTPTSSGFEQEASFVLGEVIDRTTIDNLSRAQRSGDPAKRAEAARMTRDAVAKRLELLRQKRQQIELRAKQLRKK